MLFTHCVNNKLLNQCAGRTAGAGCADAAGARSGAAGHRAAGERQDACGGGHDPGAGVLGGALRVCVRDAVGRAAGARDRGAAGRRRDGLHNGRRCPRRCLCLSDCISDWNSECSSRRKVDVWEPAAQRRIYLPSRCHGVQYEVRVLVRPFLAYLLLPVRFWGRKLTARPPRQTQPMAPLQAAADFVACNMGWKGSDGWATVHFRCQIVPPAQRQ